MTLRPPLVAMRDQASDRGLIAGDVASGKHDQIAFGRPRDSCAGRSPAWSSPTSGRPGTRRQAGRAGRRASGAPARALRRSVGNVELSQAIGGLDVAEHTPRPSEGDLAAEVLGEVEDDLNSVDRRGEATDDDAAVRLSKMSSKPGSRPARIKFCPGRSAFVESASSASTPWSPYSVNRSRSIEGPTTGVSSTLKSPE